MFINNKYKSWYDQIILNAQNRSLTGYFEKHHIIPKSLGGNNNQDNLVKLTAREHFICHLLLTKFTTGKAKSQMYFALNMLRVSNNYQDRYISSRIYETLKKNLSFELSKMHKGKVISDKTKKLISDSRKGRPSAFKGKTHTIKTKKHISITNQGHTRNSKDIVKKIINSRAWYSHSEETKAKISNSNKGKHNNPKSEETKAKISDSLKGRKKPEDFGKKISAANTGNKHSEKTKALMSEQAKNRKKLSCPFCDKNVSPANYKRWHGDNCKFKNN